jgi:hypothetical protein
MWLVDRVPLVDFYDGYRKALREQGAAFLLLALIRDADAPLFYEDLERYWSALDDVTGPSIVFAVAGPAVADRLKTRSVLFDSEVSHFTPQFAVASNRDGQPVRNVRPDDGAVFVDDLDVDEVRSLPSMYKRFARPARDLALANTSQIGALARHLSLSEAQLPCLHLTFFAKARDETAIVPLRGSPEFSIYTTCKDLVEYFGAFIPTVDHKRFERLEQGAALAVREITSRSDRLKIDLDKFANNAPDRMDHRAVEIVDELRTSIARETAPEHAEFLDGIIEATLYGERTSSRLNKIKSKIAKLRPDVGGERQIKLLLELVALTYRPRSAATFQGDLERQHAMELDKRKALLGRVERELTEAKDKVGAVKTSLTLAVENERVGRERFLSEAEPKFANLARVRFGSAESHRWKFFVSYPSQDRAAAEQVFRLLEKWGRTFMDKFCLLPGDQWRRRIPDIQGNSDISVVLMTHHTAGAHFQISEIHRAISLMRSSRHRILPVYVSADVPPEFGLEQIHSIRGRSVKEATERLNLYLEDVGNQRT